MVIIVKQALSFPFERNGFFPGKLLTARDLEAEQRYFNDKRSLINRFFGGVGIVCGLIVTRLDSARVIIESGFALDGVGREIIVPETLIKRLSELDGFTSCEREKRGHVYLCVEYAELQKEPSQAITDSAGYNKQYGRIEEAYRLFLTHDVPFAPKGEEGREESARRERNETQSLEKLLGNRMLERIYLAKLELRWDAAYEICEIEPVPFAHRVASLSELLEAVEELDERVCRIEKIASEPQVSEAENSGAHDAEPPVRRAASGIVRVEIPKGAKQGQAFYSKNIPHGLGAGEVYITLGLCRQDSAVYGSPSVFSDTAAYEFAARADMADGTFQAGVLLRAEVSDTVKLSWIAVREKPENETRRQAPRIVVTPNAVTLKPGGAVTFKAEVYDIDSRDVYWSVQEADGGHVDSYGRYTAPGGAGVFEIVARSAASSEVSGTAYVIVRE